MRGVCDNLSLFWVCLLFLTSLDTNSVCDAYISGSSTVRGVTHRTLHDGAHSRDGNRLVVANHKRSKSETLHQNRFVRESTARYGLQNTIIDSIASLEDTIRHATQGLSFDQFIQTELNSVTGTDVKQVGSVASELSNTAQNVAPW